MKLVGIIFGAALLLGGTSQAHATFIVNMVQSGSDVVMSGSGTLNLTGLTPPTAPTTCNAHITPASPLIILGPRGSAVSCEGYSSVSGPSSFGTVHFEIIPDSGDGDIVGINHTSLLVPTGYVSGSALSDTNTFDGATFATLDVTPGTYVWTWWSGADADSFTLNIGTVPEPASLAIFGTGLAVLGVVRRKRKAS